MGKFGAEIRKIRRKIRVLKISGLLGKPDNFEKSEIPKYWEF